MNILTMIIACIVMMTTFNILEIIYCILEQTSFSISIKRNIIYLFASAVHYYIYYNYPNLKIILSIIMSYLPLFILSIKNKITIKNQIYDFMITYFIIIIVDTLVDLLTYKSLSKLSKTIILTINTLLSNLFFIIASKVRIIRIHLRKTKYLIGENKIIRTILIIIILILYLIALYHILSKSEENIKLLLSILLTLLLIIYYLLINAQSRISTLKKYISNMEENTDGNNNNYKKLLIEKHNINNFLYSLKGLNKEEIDKSIDKYLNNKSNYNSSTNLNYLPLSIAGFIINKFNKNIKRLIVLENNSNKILKLKNPKAYNELCNTLGIAIDNALMASTKCKDNKIYISYYSDKKTEITIINSFNNNLNINKIGNYNYTTKKDGNGIGLYSLRNNKYIKHNIRIFENKFYFTIRIK